jgi:chemotaxis protein histidine kinase CheA
MHIRYDAEHFPEDLVLQETADRNNFQGRYVLRHPWTGNEDCPATEEYRRQLIRRNEQEAQQLADLTGWNIADVRTQMNLRGTVIPVVDLRTRFAMPNQEYSKFTVIVVVTVRDKVIGLVVDAVSDVLDVLPSQIRERPALGERTDLRFIGGMATVGEKLVVLLDIERLLSEDDLQSTGAADAA